MPSKPDENVVDLDLHRVDLHRRRLLGLGVAAAAAGVAGMLRPDAAGATTGAMQYGTSNDSGSNATGLTSANATWTLNLVNSNGGNALRAGATSGGVTADISNSAAGTAVKASTASQLQPAIDASNSAGAAISATSGGNNGSVFQNLSGGLALSVYVSGGVAPAIETQNWSSATGLYVQGNGGPGDPGVRVEVGSACTGAVLRAGQGTALDVKSGWQQVGTGHAVVVNQSNTGCAMSVTRDAVTTVPNVRIIDNQANAAYTLMVATKSTTAAVAVDAGAKGRGVKIHSDVAHMRLAPSSKSTHPASGQAGDLFVDAAKRLWFCKGGASWHQLA